MTPSALVDSLSPAWLQVGSVGVRHLLPPLDRRHHVRAHLLAREDHTKSAALSAGDRADSPARSSYTSYRECSEVVQCTIIFVVVISSIFSAIQFIRTVFADAADTPCDHIADQLFPSEALAIYLKSCYSMVQALSVLSLMLATRLERGIESARDSQN